MDGEKWVEYKAKAGTTATHVGVASIQQAILSGGPVEASFAVFDDFYNYDSGVYVRKSWNFAGMHAVKMLGWGHDNATNLDYWIMQNSWGPSWGMNGFFNILRGQDECLIETDVVAANAQL
jgi:cathepsin B